MTPTKAQTQSSHVRKVVISPYHLPEALDGIPPRTQNQESGLSLCLLVRAHRYHCSPSDSKIAPQRNEPDASVTVPRPVGGPGGRGSAKGTEAV